MQSLAKQIEANADKSSNEDGEPKYSYKDVPRYHDFSNQAVSVRYPSDESAKFPHFPVVDTEVLKIKPKKRYQFDNVPQPSSNKFNHNSYNRGVSRDSKTTSTRRPTTTTRSTTTTTTRAPFTRVPFIREPETTIIPSLNNFRGRLKFPEEENEVSHEERRRPERRPIETASEESLDYGWGQKVEGGDGGRGTLGSTTLRPKFLEPVKTSVPTRGPVVSETGVLINNEDGSDQFGPSSEWFKGLKNDPLLPPLMPGYGAPDLYGQDLSPVRPKRKPIKVVDEGVVEVTTYKPHFDNDVLSVVNSHEKQKKHGFGILPHQQQQQQGHLQHEQKFHHELFQPYGGSPSANNNGSPLLLENSRLPNEREISYLLPSSNQNPKRSPNLNGSGGGGRNHANQLLQLVHQDGVGGGAGGHAAVGRRERPDVVRQQPNRSPPAFEQPYQPPQQPYDDVGRPPFVSNTPRDRIKSVSESLDEMKAKLGLNAKGKASANNLQENVPLNAVVKQVEKPALRPLGQGQRPREDPRLLNLGQGLRHTEEHPLQGQRERPNENYEQRLQRPRPQDPQGPLYQGSRPPRPIANQGYFAERPGLRPSAERPPGPRPALLQPAALGPAKRPFTNFRQDVGQVREERLPPQPQLEQKFAAQPRPQRKVNPQQRLVPGPALEPLQRPSAQRPSVQQQQQQQQQLQQEQNPDNAQGFSISVFNKNGGGYNINNVNDVKIVRFPNFHNQLTEQRNSGSNNNLQGGRGAAGFYPQVGGRRSSGIGGASGEGGQFRRPRLRKRLLRRRGRN